MLPFRLCCNFHRCAMSRCSCSKYVTILTFSTDTDCMFTDLSGVGRTEWGRIRDDILHISVTVIGASCAVCVQQRSPYERFKAPESGVNQ